VTVGATKTLGGRRRCRAGRVLAVAALCVAMRPADGLADDGVATMVVCAPGFPGSTVEAQPAMDVLATAISAAAKWQPGALAAVYFETESAGLERLARLDATLALVPLPFWLQHQAALQLKPILQAVQQGGEAAEPWRLVAAKGAVSSPASLAGYEIVSLAGYVPRFVRGPALGAWGELPLDVRITFSGAVLTGLRRASAGNKVVVLLDRAQAAALPTLPFAAKLEIVTSSGALPVSVLCAVGERIAKAKVNALRNGLLTLGQTPEGTAALAGVRLSGFVPIDDAAIAKARDAYAKTKS
jgi:hypothetical protein